jgi:protein Mpv17
MVWIPAQTINMAVSVRDSITNPPLTAAPSGAADLSTSYAEPRPDLLQLIPLHLRLLYVNAINVPWNTFLSIQANKGKPLDPEKALVEKIKHIKHTKHT